MFNEAAFREMVLQNWGFVKKRDTSYTFKPSLKRRDATRIVIQHLLNLNHKLLRYLGSTF